MNKKIINIIKIHKIIIKLNIEEKIIISIQMKIWYLNKLIWKLIYFLIKQKILKISIIYNRFIFLFLI